jgi:hypothetical protein
MSGLRERQRMNRKNRRTIAPLIAAAVAMCAIDAAEADVTVQESIVVEGAGLMSIANMSGTSTSSISGKRNRMETDMRMKSGLVRMFARGAGQGVEIVRLDEDKVYELDMKKKRYRETSLADRRAQLAKAVEQAGQAQQRQTGPMDIDDSQCDWSDPKAEISKPGARETIAGFSAQHVSVVVRQSCKDRRSGEVCSIALSLEEWLAPLSDAGRELMQFRSAYAQQMGMVGEGRDVVERAQGLFGRYKAAWALVAKEMRNLNGFPVKTGFAFGMGGGSCSATPADAGAGGGAPSPAAVASQIGSLFGRKSEPDEPSTSSAPVPAALAGMVVPLRVTSQMLSMSSEPLSPGTFDVPEGFRKLTK